MNDEQRKNRKGWDVGLKEQLLQNNSQVQDNVCERTVLKTSGTVKYRLGELTPWLHDAEAQWDDFSGEEEVNHFLFICFHQGTCSKQRETASWER